MTKRQKLWLGFAGIVVLTVLAGVINHPKGPDIAIGDYQKELKVHLGLDLQGGTSLLYDADVSEIPEEERGTALEGVRDVIEQRINAFGVSEPNIQTVHSGEDRRVLVELPGVTDITEAVNRIGETPLLEFKTEGEAPELTEEEKEAIRQQNEEAKATAQSLLERARNGEDFSALAIEFSEDPVSAAEGGDLGELEEGQTVEEFDQVLFETGIVGEVHPELVETIFGWHIIRIDERNVVVKDDNEGNVSTAKAHHILIRSESEENQQIGAYYEDTGLTGEQLDRADVTFDPNSGLPTVTLTFNKEGKDLFAQITRDHIGESVAIYLDGIIISAPVVQTEIANGEAVISGNFTLQESKELAQRLNAGALPVPITLISQQNVGPSLGQTSIERSIFAGIVGLIALCLFMIIYYRWTGIMAIIALAIYFSIVLALFKFFAIALTLAGIAGFILSIGIAVDANVLIFERTKEELRAGKPVKKAIEDGFARAWTSIRDSNLSSLITCLLLYWFGSSLIRGFAVTLSIGILVSMFSAITITRTFLLLWPLKNSWWYGVANQTSKESKE